MQFRYRYAMTRSYRMHKCARVERQHEAAEQVRESGDYAIVFRGVQRSLVMLCPDGCGEILTINLDPRSGKAWRLDERDDGRVTLYPSVWRQEGCRAHFIIWRDTILWCDGRWSDVDLDKEIMTEIEKVLQFNGSCPMHYHRIAEEAFVHPWEALWACQILAKQGRAQTHDRVSFSARSPVRPPVGPERR